MPKVYPSALDDAGVAAVAAYCECSTAATKRLPYLRARAPMKCWAHDRAWNVQQAERRSANGADATQQERRSNARTLTDQAPIPDRSVSARMPDE